VGNNSFMKRIDTSCEEEHEKKIDHRTHKWEHVPDQKINPQEEVDEQTRNFGDNF
jgi:hypothetical protein